MLVFSLKRGDQVALTATSFIIAQMMGVTIELIKKHGMFPNRSSFKIFSMLVI